MDAFKYIKDAVRRELTQSVVQAFRYLDSLLQPEEIPAAAPAMMHLTVAHVSNTSRNASIAAVMALRTIHAMALKMWNGSTLRTPADGVPAAELMFAQFVVLMLSSSASPAFTDASKKAGVEALRQALFSHKDMAPLFHQQQYKADTIFIANAAARGGVGSNVVHLALAVLSVMYWMQNERSRSTASIPAALAIELLLNDNSFDPDALPTMRQEELTKMTLSQEVISFVTSVNHEDQNLKLNGPEWSVEQQDKRHAWKEAPRERYRGCTQTSSRVGRRR